MATSKMAWSKSTRIKVMITIDTAFFLLELIAGFLAHSLALTADAFHMVSRNPPAGDCDTSPSATKMELLMTILLVKRHHLPGNWVMGRCGGAKGYDG